jgi:hypothetical protein
MRTKEVQTCAFCGVRDAVGYSPMDGRLYAACEQHFDDGLEEDVAIPFQQPGRGGFALSRVELIATVVKRSPGMTYAELAAACGVEIGTIGPRNAAQVRFRRTLRNAVRTGRVRAVKVPSGGARYYP